MRYLLDTHAFLWFVLNDPQLSATAHANITDPNNDILISPVSYWEIAINISLKKYATPMPFDVFLEQQLTTNEFDILPIEPKHMGPLVTLPYHHRDLRVLYGRIELESDEVAPHAFLPQNLSQNGACMKA